MSRRKKLPKKRETEAERDARQARAELLCEIADAKSLIKGWMMHRKLSVRERGADQRNYPDMCVWATCHEDPAPKSELCALHALVYKANEHEE